MVSNLRKVVDALESSENRDTDRAVRELIETGRTTIVTPSGERVRLAISPSPSQQDCQRFAAEMREYDFERSFD